MAVVTNITVVCVIISYCLEDRYDRFGVIYCLLVQDRTVKGAGRNEECYREGRTSTGAIELFYPVLLFYL
jgi:hypothetical protein